MEDYEIKAEDFLKKTGTIFKCEFLKNGFHFEDDKEPRDIYLITLKRGEREYKFNFGNSIIESGLYIAYTKEGKKMLHNVKDAMKERTKHNQVVKNKSFKEPTAYDVLACMEKYEVGDFKDFCGNYGYNEDSIKAEKIYKAVKNEYENLKMLYNDEELSLMQEIQ